MSIGELRKCDGKKCDKTSESDKLYELEDCKKEISFLKAQVTKEIEDKLDRDARNVELLDKIRKLKEAGNRMAYCSTVEGFGLRASVLNWQKLVEELEK